jgi:phosphopantetheine adenylyltransferase
MAAPAAPPAALLLLPTPTSPASLRTRFGPTIASVLPSLADSVKDSDHVARLDLGILLPKTFSTRLSPRASVFPRVQELVKDLYTLLGSIAVEVGVKLDVPGGVDARVFMFEDQSGHPADRAQVAHSFSGPIIDLSILVSSGRVYDPVFSVESEDGEKVLRAFLDLHGKRSTSHPNVCKIKVGESEKVGSREIPELRKARAAHKSVAVGGTFEQLRIGDKLLLTATAVVVEPETDDIISPSRRRITIGITADEALHEKNSAGQVKSWDERQENVADFFESIVAFSKNVKTFRVAEHFDQTGPNGKCVSVQLGPTLTIIYVEISDHYGLTITDEGISALVVSKGKEASAKAINDKREEKGWSPLEVFEVDEVDAES